MIISHTYGRNVQASQVDFVLNPRPSLQQIITIIVNSSIELTLCQALF